MFIYRACDSNALVILQRNEQDSNKNKIEDDCSLFVKLNSHNITIPPSTVQENKRLNFNQRKKQFLPRLWKKKKMIQIVLDQ